MSDLQKPSHPNMAAGCLPRMSAPGEYLPIIGDVDTAPLIPRHKLADMDLTAHDPPAVDQGKQSSCTAAALATALRHLRKLMGAPDVPLAWSTIYGPGNGGNDSGSAIDTVVNHLIRVGICPAEVEGQPYIDPFDWQGYYRGTWPDDWQQKAKGYRLLEAWDNPSFDHTLSGMHHGYPGVIGVFWPGGGGHAVFTVGYNKTKRKVLILNTWSRAWGERGYGWIDEDLCIRGVPYFGGFNLRAASWGPLDPNPPSIK